MIDSLRIKPKTSAVVVFVIFAFLLNLYATKVLNESYEASKFQVPYYEAQLSFSDEKIKEWYAYLIEQDTFDVYVQTQFIDFLFILSVLLLHFFALLLVSRMFQRGTLGRKILIICALLSTIAPLADVLENIVSFFMLANPAEFSPWLTLVYSSFAAIKFAFFVFAYIVVVLGILTGLCSMYMKRNEK